MSEFPTDFHRRLGRVSISNFIIDEHPEYVARHVLKDAIIIRCEFMLYDNSLEYILRCVDFDPVPMGGMAPRYEVIFTLGQDRTLTHEWRKVS